MDTYPSPFDAATTELFSGQAQVLAVPAGTRLFGHGMPCRQFALVYSGIVRVQTVSESGREIVLYRVHPGEACVMTTACLLAHAPYAAEGVAETECRIAMLPEAGFEQLLAQAPSFRQFVFAACGKRLVDLMLLFEEVAFQRIDIRLASFLLQTAQDELTLTHQAIASELGSAREVISRQLGEFERRGWLRLQRGKIELRDRAALQALLERR